LLFLLVGHPSENGTHLRVMAKLIRMCRDPELREDLVEAATPKAFLQVIEDAEEEAQ
jgi:mannitol/fructose-specific phosphotransferase system IIA component (Ntr-type)